VPPHPLGNTIEFHELSPNPNDLDLTWHEYALVSKPISWFKEAIKYVLLIQALLFLRGQEQQSLRLYI